MPTMAWSSGFVMILYTYTHPSRYIHENEKDKAGLIRSLPLLRIHPSHEQPQINPQSPSIAIYNVIRNDTTGSKTANPTAYVFSFRSTTVLPLLIPLLPDPSERVGVGLTVRRSADEVSHPVAVLYAPS